MKKIFLIIFAFTSLQSSDIYELQMYQNILTTLFQKDTILVYSRDADEIELIKTSTNIKLTTKCSDADVLIGKNFSYPEFRECKKPIFATSYRSYMEQENAFAVFYWRKGRPQIQFKLEPINRYKLFLPENFKKYSK